MGFTENSVSKINKSFHELVHVICKASGCSGRTRAILIEEFHERWEGSYGFDGLGPSARRKLAQEIRQRGRELEAMPTARL